MTAHKHTQGPWTVGDQSVEVFGPRGEHIVWEMANENAEANARLIAVAPDMEEALRVIYSAVRGDEKSECWKIRKFLDDRKVFNDDIQGAERLIAEVCRWVLEKAWLKSAK